MTHLFERRYADRNPYYTMPDPTVDIAVDGPKAALYRISPEEPWRVMRTKWRVEGLEEGIEAGGRASGYFSSACGLMIYRGNAFPREYVGDAFVADPAENIVHHKKVVHTGPTASAERPADEKRVEFLASRDTWFRPVFMANAPDGTLYIADMYRQIIEALGIPDEIAKHLDFDAGADMGRIYRVVPDGFKQPLLPAELDEVVNVWTLLVEVEHVSPVIDGTFLLRLCDHAIDVHHAFEIPFQIRSVHQRGENIFSTLR